MSLLKSTTTFTNITITTHFPVSSCVSLRDYATIVPGCAGLCPPWYRHYMHAALGEIAMSVKQIVLDPV